ncbi:MAG: peptide ABC transporter ATP-binding protein [Alphaproteobacteria bacterium]
MSGPLLLEAKELARHYAMRRGIFGGKATLKALDGVTFSVAAGETLAVVGESGCGKSTLARQVMLIEPPTSGQLMIEGRNAAGADKAEIRELRRKVQIVFQDPFGSLNPRKKVSAILDEPLVINTSLGRAERTERAHEIMAKVGLRAEHYDRYPHMFSGGQRQRIAIARALMIRPAIVVADEPVSALDVSIQAQVLNLLMDLQEEMNLAYLFISHDLSVVRHLAGTVMVMYLGRAVEHGAARAIFSAPRHPYTQALLASTPHVDPTQRKQRVPVTGELPSPLDPPPGCAFNTRCPYVTEECTLRRPELREIDGRLVSCHHAETIAANADRGAQPGRAAR